MCKFTNRLFVFVLLYYICTLFVVAQAAIARSKNKHKRDGLEDILDILTPDNDYDLHYDQRQKGEENLSLHFDGFFIGLPAMESSANLPTINDDFLENLGEELLLGLGKSRLTTSTSTLASSSSSSSTTTTVAPHELTLENLQENPFYDNYKLDKTIIEIPAPKKYAESLQFIESKGLEQRKAATRSKFKLGQLLNLLLRARKIGKVSQVEN